jgi:dCTP diphosphatase
MSTENGWSDAHTSLMTLRERLADFNRQRDWPKFHTPKDLAIALSVEVAELLEFFLWRAEPDEKDAAAVQEELADVMICLVNLTQRLDVDLLAAVEEKIATNALRYPVDKAKGRAEKYNRLP